MRKSIVAALLAAASLLPGAAMAQRGDDDRRGLDRNARGVAIENRQTVDQDRADRGPRPDRPQSQPRGDDGPRADRGDRGGRGGPGGGDRRGPDAGQPAVVAQAERGDRGGFRNDAGRGPDNRGDRQWRGNDGGRGNGQWRGNDDRGGTVQWRGNDNRGNQWQGNQGRGSQARGNPWRGNDRGNWNRGWRQDNRYDWNRRRQVNRNAFHLPRYYAPSNWSYGYRRFNVGITLTSGLFNRNYWIDDADYYGLPDAYGPYRWVRYYNDALLVDVYSGQVVDTVYDIFW